MSLLWGEYKSRKKVLYCVHEEQSIQPQQEVPALEVTSKQPVATADIHVNPSVVNDAAAEPIARDSMGRGLTCRQEKLEARRYRTRLIIGLFLPFALQALDTTIVASALSWIASDFHELSQMNWIISSFNLCSASFIPFWGQIVDIFGRTATMEAALLLMMVGSALCVAAPSNAIPVFILGRAIQGLSVSGITVCTRVILCDKVSLKENAKNNSIFALFAGIAYAIGPLIGGFLTDKNWKWCFGINLPVATVAIVLVFFVLRPELLGPQPVPELLGQDGEQGRVQKLKAQLSTIDFGGQLLFFFGLGLLVLGLTWGGGKYAWNDVHVVAPLVIGSILSVCFVIWQYLMSPGHYLSRKLPVQRPTLPWELLAQRNMYLLFYINFAAGMAITAVLYFTDFYFVNVELYRPSKAGLQLLYYTPGIGIGVYSAMIMCNIYPRQTFLPLFLGSIIEATGISVLAWALHQGHHVTICFMMGLTGAGTGLRFMPMSLHGIGFFPNNIASVIAMTSFAIPFGGTIAMTTMSAVFFNKTGFAISGSSSLATLPAEIRAQVQAKVRDGVVWAFISILPFMWICVVAAACLGNVKITRKRKIDEQGQTDFSENTTEGAFLAAFLRRRFGGGSKVQHNVAEEGKGEAKPNTEAPEVKAVQV